MGRDIKVRGTSEALDKALKSEEENKGRVTDYVRPAPRAGGLQFIDSICSNLLGSGFSTVWRDWVGMVTVLRWIFYDSVPHIFKGSFERLSRKFSSFRKELSGREVESVEELQILSKFESSR